jgi:hypothetical protein
MSDLPIPGNFDDGVHWFLGTIVLFALGCEGVTMVLGGQFLLSGIAFVIALGLLAFMVYWPPGSALILLMVGAALLSFLGTLEACKRWNISGGRKMLTVGIGLMVVAVICAAIGGAILLVGVQTQSATATVTTQTTASAVAAPSGIVLAPSATLRLLIRPNQDPQELVRDNVWRWFVFKMMGVNPAGQQITLATFIFLTFDHPVQTGYRRVFSLSNPNLRFDILELNERSMIATINNVDITGETVEVQVSGSPL